MGCLEAIAYGVKDGWGEVQTLLFLRDLRFKARMLDLPTWRPAWGTGVPCKGSTLSSSFRSSVLAQLRQSARAPGEGRKDRDARDVRIDTL